MFDPPQAGVRGACLLPMLFILVLTLTACSAPDTGPTADAWLREVRTEMEVGDKIRHTVRRFGGTPLRFGADVVFVARGSDEDPPQIVGDFNDGGFADSPLLENGRMARIGQSDWYVASAACPQDVRFEYLVKVGDTTRPDPLNPQRVTTFGNERSSYAGPTARMAPLRAPGTPTGAVREFQFKSRIRDNERTISVYLPPGYRPDGPRLPTLYVKDGTRFRESGLPRVVDALIAERRLPPVLCVFVDPVNRGREYGTSTAYRRMVIEELVPEVERRFASGGSAAKRGLFGASRGGLAALDLMTQPPATFGFVAVMSPAIAPLPFIDQLAERDRLPGRYLVLPSRYDTPRLVLDGRQLARVLGDRADELTVRELPIDHSPHGWAQYLDFMLLTWCRDWN